MGLEEFVLDRERRVEKKEGQKKTTYEKDVAFTKTF
jgi:hypothetical protein